MMPLLLATPGQEVIVNKVGGKPDVRQHLNELGFTVGSPVTVVSSVNGNLIVKVKESRVALDKSLANKIMV